MPKNPLIQYLDLYEAESSFIREQSPEALNMLREAALESLRQAGRFPDKSDRDFEKTSIADMFAPDFGMNTRGMALKADIAASFRCGVPNLSTLMAFVVNDRFVPTATLMNNLPEGVTVCSLSEAAERFGGTVERYYGSVADMTMAGVALNTLFVRDGVFIHVDKGVKVSRPIQIVNIFATDFPFLAPRRVLVVAEEGAEISVLKCDHTQRQGVAYMSSEVVEIIAHSAARVGWYDLEEATANTSRYCQLFVHQDRDSDVNLCEATLSNGTTRNELRVVARAENTNTRIYGMSIAAHKQHVDNFTSMTHRADHGHSDQILRYILLDESTGAFEGSIEVCEGARFCEAFQNNRNLLGSEGARMHTKPQLLIYNDDVKCSHGATTGQLDARALFYMRSRGIPAEEARHMLMQAFMAPVVNAIPLDPLRDRLLHMIDRRLSGHAASCDSCGGCIEGD